MRQFIPVLGTREGARRSLGVPLTNGFIDYVTLLNERDGGINGVTLVWEECETVYDVDRGVECYEHLKAKGPTGAAAFYPTGTPLTYALTERATRDQIPLVAMGIGRSDAAEGRVFPYVFPVPATWWSQNTAKIRFIGQRAGSMTQLKGLKIAHVYYDAELGRETLPMLDTQAAHYGFTVQHLAVKPPGLDQKATWLRVKVAQPDWVLLRSQGVMTATALKEAAQVGFPRDKMVGPTPTCTEQEIVPAGEAAIGFICAMWHGSGNSLPAHPGDAPVRLCPGQRGGAGRGCRHGAVDPGHAARPAHHGGDPHGHAPLRPPAPDRRAGAVGARAPHPHRCVAQRDGGGGPDPPLTLSCRDHEGGGGVKFQQWDGTQWTAITDWIAADQALVRPMVEASAAKYAQDKGITPRDCP